VRAAVDNANVRRAFDRLRWLPFALAVGTLALAFGATGATAASKAPSNAGKTIGTCTVVAHPTAALHTVCVGASLEHAPLSHVDLSYAVLTSAKLNDADLAGANLTGATLTKAVLTGANLNGATWSGTTCPDGTDSDAVGYSCAGQHLSTTAYPIPPDLVAGPPSSLPFTGFDPWPFVLTGAALIALGLLLLELPRVIGRRRRPETS
jgi:hypothetical protein